MLLNSLNAPADLAHRLADVTYQIVALQTLNHAMGTDHPSLTDAIVDAVRDGRITGREQRILQDLNDQANASKHDDLGPGRLYRPSLEGGPHLRKVVIVSGPESVILWEKLTDLVALSAGALDEMVVGSFPMEGKAKRAPYVAVQSAMAAPTLLPPCLGVGRGACRGPPTSRSGRPRSASVGRRISSWPGSAQTRDGGASSPQPGAGHQAVPAARAAGAGCQPAAGAGCQPVAGARPHPAPVAAGPSPAPIWARPHPTRPV